MYTRRGKEEGSEIFHSSVLIPSTMLVLVVVMLVTVLARVMLFPF